MRLFQRFHADGDGLQLGTAFASKTPVQTPKLKLSGADFVHRLEHLGFATVRAAYGMTLLRRADKRVMVPDVETIEADMMEAIFRSAGITESEFFGRTRSGIFVRESADDGRSSKTTDPLGALRGASPETNESGIRER